MQNVRHLVTVAFLSVVGCVPRETSVVVVESSSPSAPTSAPAPDARLVARELGPVTVTRYGVAPVPFPTSETAASPSLLDPMDSCLPQAATPGKAAGSVALDRNALDAELRWAKTRAEKCCPRYPGSARVVVTVGPNGAPSNVGVALPGVASADLGKCIRKLFDDVRVTPFVGASVVAASSVSTENAPAPSTM